MDRRWCGTLVVVCLCSWQSVFAGQPAQPNVELVVGAQSEGAKPLGGELIAPFAVDADPQGHLFIAELKGGRVLKVSPDGHFAILAGTGEKGFTGDDGPALKAQFNGMHHLALLPSGDLLVADTWNCCVRKIDLKSGLITRLAGTGKKGLSGDGGPALQADCGGIYCLALDQRRHRLLLADLDNRRIRSVDLASGKIDTIAGNGQKGVPADGSAARNSPLVDPRAVACDARGNVYILERSGHALRMVTLDGRIRTVAGTGRKGPAVDDVQALAATLAGPKHLCVDPHGDVIIADTDNHVIRKLLVRQHRLVRIVGTGRVGSAGVGGPALEVQLNQPHGVFVDTKGVLFIADSLNNRVLRLPEP
jgi:hypothetical protein